VPLRWRLQTLESEMAMSVSDHHHRIRDLERAFVAALRVLTEHDAGRRSAIREEAHRLRVDGDSGAAAVLEGKLVRAYAR